MLYITSRCLSTKIRNRHGDLPVSRNGNAGLVTFELRPDARAIAALPLASGQIQGAAGGGNSFNKLLGFRIRGYQCFAAIVGFAAAGQLICLPGQFNCSGSIAHGWVGRRRKVARQCR